MCVVGFAITKCKLYEIKLLATSLNDVPRCNKNAHAEFSSIPLETHNFVLCFFFKRLYTIIAFYSINLVNSIWIFFLLKMFGKQQELQIISAIDNLINLQTQTKNDAT